MEGIAATHPEQAAQLTIQVLPDATRTDADRALELTRTLQPESMLALFFSIAQDSFLRYLSQGFSRSSLRFGKIG